MSIPSDKTQENNQPEKKKISLEEAIKQKLAQKKQKQSTEKHSNHPAKNTNKMQSQHVKKPNQRRKTGG